MFSQNNSPLDSSDSTTIKSVLGCADIGNLSSNTPSFSNDFSGATATNENGGVKYTFTFKDSFDSSDYAVLVTIEEKNDTSIVPDINWVIQNRTKESLTIFITPLSPQTLDLRIHVFVADGFPQQSIAFARKEEKVHRTTIPSGDTQHDFDWGLAQESISDFDVIIIDTTLGAVTLSGIKAPNPKIDHTIKIINTGSFPIQILAENGGSAEENQLAGSVDYNLGEKNGGTLFYDKERQSWWAL